METNLSGIVETTILQFESYEVMSDSCVLAVDQRQWPMGDPEYGDKLLTDGSGGPYTDACLAVWADWEETGVSILGQSSTKGGGFTYHSLLTQVRDKKVLLCMCFSQAIRGGNEDGKG